MASKLTRKKLLDTTKGNNAAMFNYVLILENSDGITMNKTEAAR